MVKKLFVLGNPGCGKSTVIHSIERSIDQKNHCEHVNDYNILKDMFEKGEKTENGTPMFRAVSHGGFCVIDIRAFDKALQRLEEQIKERLYSCAEPATLLLIEFSRNDYQRAFQQFDHVFLQDAYFLYLETSIEICKRRVRERVQKPRAEKTADDYCVPDAIFDAYYSLEPEENSFLAWEQLGISRERILILPNNEDSLEPLLPKIQAFFHSILEAKESSESPADYSCSQS